MVTGAAVFLVVSLLLLYSTTGYVISGTKGRRIITFALKTTAREKYRSNICRGARSPDLPEDFERRSQIRYIRSKNLAGVLNYGNESKDIIIPFDTGKPMIAVTGETGSGKSLLVAKVVELITGAKAAPYFVSFTSNTTAYAEVEFSLVGRYLEATARTLERVGLDRALLHRWASQEGDCGRLTLRRTMFLQIDDDDDNNSNNNHKPSENLKKPRLGSVCQVNGVQVSLPVLVQLARPLVTVVDAASAAVALSKMEARMAILDAALFWPSVVAESIEAQPHVIPESIQARTIYRERRLEREKLEKELDQRTLPKQFASIRSSEKEENDSFGLINHWVQELDEFQRRVMQLCAVLQGDRATHEDETEINTVAQELALMEWTDSATTTAKDGTFSSALYTKLVELQAALRSHQEREVAARNALESLAALSSPQSARTALERARHFLHDATASGGQTRSDKEKSPLSSMRTSSNKVSVAAERTHELLNEVEAVLLDCAASLEDETDGLIGRLESSRLMCPVTEEQVSDLLGAWNALSRKHGISPYALPSCHVALQNEQSGTVHARQRLPVAVAAERDALRKWRGMASRLSTERQRIATYVSKAVTERLPSLGLGQSVFRANLLTRVKECTDESAWAGNASVLGVDAVQFLLLPNDKYDNDNNNDSYKSANESQKRNGGQVHEVASSGEKARILLAIECVLPGALGAALAQMRNDPIAMAENGVDNDDSDSENSWSSLPPVAVLYDEIDAHVGGRAAVSMANMLFEQSCSSQVVAITHSQSVAAIADAHIIIQRKQPTEGYRTTTTTSRTSSATQSMWVQVSMAKNEMERCQELARMASGDVVLEEAEAFAQALLEAGERQRTDRRQRPPSVALNATTV